MAFTSPSLLETFHLIHPKTAYFSQSCIQPISALPFDWLRLLPHRLRHLLQVTAEDTKTNGAELLMPTLLGTCSPFRSERQPCPNCTTLDLGPLWCLHDTPVALRINTDPLVAFQLRCPNKRETELQYARFSPQSFFYSLLLATDDGPLLDRKLCYYSPLIRLMQITF